eukprot:366305-Chlamydomonas_euryale.AAC.6
MVKNNNRNNNYGTSRAADSAVHSAVPRGIPPPAMHYPARGRATSPIQAASHPSHPSLPSSLHLALRLMWRYTCRRRQHAVPTVKQSQEWSNNGTKPCRSTRPQACARMPACQPDRCMMS